MKLTERTVLDVGWKCNAHCIFCYYKNSHEQNDPTTAELKKKLEKAKAYGAKSIEFTGGEPAIREDIFELIGYAKRLDFKRLGIITNGLLFSDFNFTRKIKKIGLREVKFSIHGPNPKIHDKVTGVDGNFKKLMIGVKNSKKVGLTIKTSTTVNQINYKTLPYISKILIKLKPSKVNFILVNPIVDAQRLNNDILASYSKIAPHLHKALDILIAEKYPLTVRYIPFCFMKGYEQYVYNLHQVQYDPDEWDYLVKNKIEYGRLISILNLLVGCLNLLKVKHVPKQNFVHEMVIQSKLLRFTTKAEQCKICKYDFICDGLWKSYAKLYGYSELNPSEGEKIKDSVYFLKD